ncbi:MAG: transglutaminase family protein [Pseudooceanicola sp.]|nr:transglutaminase family protein [Pseudooceanicola sp.]
MRFTVRHLTRYRYDRPVRLSPHLLRLTPRDASARDVAWSLTVSPTPLARIEETDRWGNAVIRLEFGDATDALVIDSRFTLDTVAPPLPAIALPPLPWRPEPDFAPWLDEPLADAAVADFAAALAGEADGDPARFVDLLTERLYTRTDRHIRPDGNAHTPAETLASRRGACRDLTVLFMAVCRGLGMPARFVSGYQARAETPDGQRHLHAWPEVHLPGVGWRGYDPTHGRRVTDAHAALCHAPDQAGTMPLEGGYYGAPVASRLDYSVEIQAD